MNEKDQDDREVLLSQVRKQRDAHALPPAPFDVRLLSGEAPVSVIHWEWRQDISSFTNGTDQRFAGVSPSVKDLAEDIRDLADPLTGLAQELMSVASYCRQSGLVAVGVNLHGEHAQDFDMFTRDQRRFLKAYVHIDVTAVPREWVTRVIHAAEQIKNPTGAAPAENSESAT